MIAVGTPSEFSVLLLEWDVWLPLLFLPSFIGAILIPDGQIKRIPNIVWRGKHGPLIV